MSDVNLVPLTDEEIDKLAMRDRLETIRSLWTTFNKEPTAQQLRFYADQFIKLPTGLLMDSVTLAIRNQRYNIAPTIRAVFDEVKGILKCTDAGLDGSIDEWLAYKHEGFFSRIGIVILDENDA